MSRPLTTRTTVCVWVARVAWLVVAFAGGAAPGDALADRSRAVQVVATAGSWVAWTAGAVSLAVAGVAMLTALRAIVPGALVVAAAAIAGGADVGPVLLLVVPAAVATVAVMSAEFGRAYLQASAYGDEERFGLRPPLGYLLASGATWLLAVGALVAAALCWAAMAWVAAIPATLVAALAALVLPRRWHQLSRRWLVFVPAGVVVHDPVVLADTLMVQRALVQSISLDPSGTATQRAADLSGPTPGLAVEVRLTSTVTAVYAPRPSAPTGTAIHLVAFVVSPTRPGAVVRTATARGY